MPRWTALIVRDGVYKNLMLLLFIDDKKQTFSIPEI